MSPLFVLSFFPHFWYSGVSETQEESLELLLYRGPLQQIALQGFCLLTVSQRAPNSWFPVVGRSKQIVAVGTDVGQSQPWGQTAGDGVAGEHV